MKDLKLVFSSSSLEIQCKEKKAARKLLGGNEALTTSLLARINALKQAETIKDIILQPQFHFHNLENKGKRKNLEGLFAIDVKSRRDSWRIILQPLDDLEEPYIPCNIGEISRKVRIVKIVEVSQHYG